VLFSLSINIGGTAVPLDVRDGDIPKSIAAAFAKEHKVTLAPRTILAYYSGKLLPIHVACHVSSPIVSCLSCESSAQLDGTAQDKITQVSGHTVSLIASPLTCVCARTCEAGVKLDAFLSAFVQAIINKATEIRRTSSGASAPAAAPSIPTAAEPPATGAAANAAAATDATGVSKDGGPQRLLFSLDVNLGGAQGKVPLDVHAGAVPADLAQQFATQYGLGSTAVAQLTEAIVSEAKQKVRATSDPGSVARAPG
jgi:hypothetical protein